MEKYYKNLFNNTQDALLLRIYQSEEIDTSSTTAIPLTLEGRKRIVRTLTKHWPADIEGAKKLLHTFVMQSIEEIETQKRQGIDDPSKGGLANLPDMTGVGPEEIPFFVNSVANSWHNRAQRRKDLRQRREEAAGSMLREFEAKEAFIKKRFKELLEGLDRKREELMMEEAKMLELLKQEYASVLSTPAGKKMVKSPSLATRHNALNIRSILNTTNTTTNNDEHDTLNNDDSTKQKFLERTKMEEDSNDSTLKQEDCDLEDKNKERGKESGKEKEKEKEAETKPEDVAPSCCGCSNSYEEGKEQEKEKENEQEKEKETENREQKEKETEREKENIDVDADVETDSDGSESPSQKSDSEDNGGSVREKSPESEYMMTAKSLVTKRSMAIKSLLLDSDQIDNFPPPSSCCFSKAGCNCSSAASKPSFKRKRQVEEDKKESSTPSCCASKRQKAEPNKESTTTTPKGDSTKGTAYVFFTDKHFPTVAARYPELDFETQVLILEQKWKKLSVEERKKYEVMAEKEKARWEKEVASHEEQKNLAFRCFRLQRFSMLSSRHPELPSDRILQILQEEWDSMNNFQKGQYLLPLESSALGGSCCGSVAPASGGGGGGGGCCGNNTTTTTTNSGGGGCCGGNNNNNNHNTTTTTAHGGSEGGGCECSGGAGGCGCGCSCESCSSKSRHMIRQRAPAVCRCKHSN